jgi:hypothetical protein
MMVLCQKIVFTIYFILFAICNYSQNLIYNGNFEIHDTCPNNQGQINYALIAIALLVLPIILIIVSHILT